MGPLGAEQPVRGGQQPGRPGRGQAGLLLALAHSRFVGPLADVHRAADQLPRMGVGVDGVQLDGRSSASVK
ncbi:hypothetical protein BJ996_007142 [Streptomyces phaeogriseichromatogenes]|nr:hypothetical protein [Streptomyces murinus]